MITGGGDKPRWLYRLESFSRAVLLLREAADLQAARPLSQLEKEGMVQRFEFTWELAWKLMKDYLEQAGIALETVTPAAVIRAGATARLIAGGDIWMQALDARNKMSHTYSNAAFDKVTADICALFLPALDAFRVRMQALAEGEPHG